MFFNIFKFCTLFICMVNHSCNRLDCMGWLYVVHHLHLIHFHLVIIIFNICHYRYLLLCVYYFVNIFSFSYFHLLEIRTSHSWIVGKNLITKFPHLQVTILIYLNVVHKLYNCISTGHQHFKKYSAVAILNILKLVIWWLRVFYCVWAVFNVWFIIFI